MLSNEIETLKQCAKNNPYWLATLTTEEKREVLSGEMDRKLNKQWNAEEKRELEQAQKDHDDWYGEY